MSYLYPLKRRKFFQKPSCRFSLTFHIPGYYHFPVFKLNTSKNHGSPCLPWIRLTSLLELGKVSPSLEDLSLMEGRGWREQNQG